MTIFIILLLSLFGVWWYIHYKNEKTNKIERLKKFHQEQKIYAQEYTSGQYDFMTYKRYIEGLHQKYQV